MSSGERSEAPSTEERHQNIVIDDIKLNIFDSKYFEKLLPVNPSVIKIGRREGEPTHLLRKGAYSDEEALLIATAYHEF